MFAWEPSLGRVVALGSGTCTGDAGGGVRWVGGLRRGDCPYARRYSFGYDDTETTIYQQTNWLVFFHSLTYDPPHLSERKERDKKK